MNTDISLVTTDDLIKEILARHDHAVFIGMRSGDLNKPDSSTLRRVWSGNAHVCAGLCQHHAIVILGAYEKNCKKADDL